MSKREDVICNNIGLVHSCARRFIGRGIEYDDPFQAGCMGLVKAADGFDEERGLKFSTYAVPVILGEIRRLFRDGGAVKVSRSLKELSMRAARERENFISNEGREPTVSEMADLLGVEIEQA
ncbi:MAG TPA: flagellar biosynthesis protein FliA, partial [Ruminococcaceae bacterium]|nr:flagellar biosynthesis protein FliA [Oscillospiraceae bacterium]